MRRRFAFSGAVIVATRTGPRHDRSVAERCRKPRIGFVAGVAGLRSR